MTLTDEINTVMAGDEPLTNLKPRKVGLNEYRVLSARNGSVTVHEVDLMNMSCTCEDMEYNKSDQEVCAHLTKALLDADDPDMEEIGLANVSNLMRQTQSALENANNAREVFERTREAMWAEKEEAAKNESTESDTETTETPTDSREDPVAKVRQAMTKQYGLPEENVKNLNIYEHDEYGSIQIEASSFIDHDGYKSAVLHNDLVEYSPDGPGADNYIASGDIDAYVRGEGA